MARGNFRQPSRQQQPRYRTNEQIRIPEIRLVGENLEEISQAVGEKVESGAILPTRKVLQWADKIHLDLVEISPNADPPVCRLTDYNKFLYERRRKEKEM